MFATSSISLFHAAALLFIVGCALNSGEKKAVSAEPLPQVLFKTSQGDVLIELYEDEAPNTVANFVSLVEKKFYDGIIFHRVIDGFMAQGGDPTGTGTGGPGHAIRCECELPNARKHQRGTLSMAHAGKDTGGSQFFLTFVATPHLDGKHTVFGQVIQGMENVDKFKRRDPRIGGDSDKIISATVVRKRNHEYKPETLPSRR
jgi:cyclophilin family peptidyl-prolyl cis-trans isomerase